MALPPLAPVSAMEIRLGLAAGTLAGSELARAEANLADVSGLVRTTAGKTFVAEDEETITAPEAVITVALQAALRAYRNPDGYAGESLEGYAWQAPQGPVGVYLSPDEVAIIRSATRAQAAETSSWTGTGAIRTPSTYANDLADPADGLWEVL